MHGHQRRLHVGVVLGVRGHVEHASAVLTSSRYCEAAAPADVLYVFSCPAAKRNSVKQGLTPCITPSHNRLLWDSNNRYVYDNEGNVIRRWNYKRLNSATTVINQDNLVGSVVLGTSVEVTSPEFSVEAGAHRIRLDSLNIDTTLLVGLARVTLTIRDKDTGQPIANTPLPMDLTKELLGEATADFPFAHVYRSLPVLWDVQLAAHDRLEIELEFDFPAADPNTGIEIDGGNLYVEVAENLYGYDWDYQNRLTAVNVEGNPATVQLSDNFNWTGYAWDSTTSYLYDVIGNRIGTTVDNGQVQKWYSIYESGQPLLEFNESGEVERSRLYAGPGGPLLAVEDYNPGTGSVPTSDIVVWTMADHQGTIRGLYSTEEINGERRKEHITYDPFGGPDQPGNPWLADTHAPLWNIVTARHMGMEYDVHAELYVAGSNVYEPLGGRLMSPRGSGNNPYIFAGNTPVNRNVAGRGTTYTSTPGMSENELFWDRYQHYFDPRSNWAEGNYVEGTIQTAGWAMAIVPAIYAAPGYFAAMAGLSAVETTIESYVASYFEAPFDAGASFAKNMAINSLTFGIGNKLKWGGKIGAYLLKKGIQITGDTVIDVGVYGYDPGMALVTNTVGSFGGEAITSRVLAPAFRGIGRAGRRGWQALRAFDGFEVDYGRAWAGMGWSMPASIKIKWRNAVEDFVHPDLQHNGALRALAREIHDMYARPRWIQDSAVAVAEVVSPNGRRSIWASTSFRFTRPQQRRLAQLGVNFVTGDSHAETHIITALSEQFTDGATIKRWGISWTTDQKWYPCWECLPHVTKVTSGILEF